MSTSVAAANSILDLIYRSVAWANLAENDASSPATTLDIALHTAAPATNLQSSNEANYGAYARVPINRTGSGFTAAAAAATANAALAQFVECTSGSNVITHVSLGQGGTIIHYGELGSPRTVSAGIQPQFAASALVATIT